MRRDMRILDSGWELFFGVTMRNETDIRIRGAERVNVPAGIVTDSAPRQRLGGVVYECRRGEFRHGLTRMNTDTRKYKILMNPRKSASELSWQLHYPPPPFRHCSSPFFPFSNSQYGLLVRSRTGWHPSLPCQNGCVLDQGSLGRGGTRPSRAKMGVFCTRGGPVPPGPRT
jgi:hypothetical protein